MHINCFFYTAGSGTMFDKIVCMWNGPNIAMPGKYDVFLMVAVYHDITSTHASGPFHMASWHIVYAVSLFY